MSSFTTDLALLIEEAVQTAMPRQEFYERRELLEIVRDVVPGTPLRGEC